MSLRRIAKRLVTVPLILLAALWLWVEEWVWDRLAAMMVWLSRLSWVRAAAAWVASLPAYVAMALFLVPVVLMLPFKVAGLWLLARGEIRLGTCVFAMAHILGTAMEAWIFAHARNALLTVRWFAAVHGAFVRLREYLRARVAELQVWRKAKEIFHAIRQWLDRLRGGALKRRWNAIRRLRERKSRARS